MSLKQEKAQRKVVEEYAANTRLMVKVGFVVAVIAGWFVGDLIKYLIGG